MSPSWWTATPKTVSAAAIWASIVHRTLTYSACLRWCGDRASTTTLQCQHARMEFARRTRCPLWQRLQHLTDVREIQELHLKEEALEHGTFGVAVMQMGLNQVDAADETLRSPRPSAGAFSLARRGCAATLASACCTFRRLRGRRQCRRHGGQRHRIRYLPLRSGHRAPTVH